MSDRHLPVHPDLDQLKHQAKDLLRGLRGGDKSAIDEFRRYHPAPPEPARAKLADAQLALARSYQVPSWPRLALACRLIDAIWDDDLETVRDLVEKHPTLLHENARILNDNWGPPMSYAANLGRDRIITMLHQRGATDLMKALDRAILQSRIDTARMLHRLLGSPKPSVDAFGSPAYTLSVSGTALLFELGASLVDADGRPSAPVGVVLESDSRNPAAKHRILEMYADHGFELPDTPMFALHRGRIDLLEAHLHRDPTLLQRTFRYEEIFPPALGCHAEQLPRTTLSGATLLHACVEFDELEIARWLLDRGMAADALAAVDANGFGGHSALFNAVVSFPNFWINYGRSASQYRAPDAPFARLLLDHGASPNAHAHLREQVFENQVPTSVREHHALTPLAWGQIYHDRRIVNGAALELIAERGGTV